MRAHELRATPNQRAILREELHDLIDQVLDQLPTVERISKEMGSGYTSTTIGDGRGGNDTLTSTERLATQHQPDPAAWAAQALTEWDTNLTNLRRTARRFRSLMPLTAAEVAKEDEDRRQTVIGNTRSCGLCELPITGKAHTVDDIPYHANTCYYKIYRAGRAKASA